MYHSIIVDKAYSFLSDFYRFIPENTDIWVEIGSGNGDYLVGLAEREPEKFFVGVEIKYKRLMKTLKKIRKKGLKNVALFHTSGEIFTNFFLKDNTISAFIFNFPDPWFKKRHHKRKIFNTTFIDELIPKLKKGGKIFIATDYPMYATEIAELVKGNPFLENINPSDFGKKWLYSDLYTKYEREFLNQGKKIYYMAFRKI